MTNLTVIEKRELLGKELKVYRIAGKSLFLAEDIASWIGYTKLSKILNMVDEDEKLRHTFYVLDQCQSNWFLTEDGLHEILMQSNNSVAKQFKQKVKEMLKDIRKQGVYATDDLENVLFYDQ